MPFYSKAFSTEPRIKVTADEIIATTSALIQVLSLGSFHRIVKVDSRTKTLEINTRYLWFLSSTRKARFQDIEHVTYEYMNSGESYVSNRSASYESFQVGLRMKNAEFLPLLRFTGDAPLSFEGFSFTPIQDALDSLTDTVGTQQENSLEIVDLLCERLDVKIGS